ncbi:type II toxin-antitoxin system PemK/MazF family toxin [Streptomyces sp. DT2A-34]|uniref:type II toxin-antitoxin system PemK/MazF family toxin n=1 Tax=Streptomyces sp. DT2A-34 TaxID=3051182 RepID=UPI00265BC7CF|nr:type II toxin-antitoxin system PemK/MazF family toxin [Streptomyces sp. DT2A-34]MDO0914583.1 type II toxin-antitoxin system PemK/MazF family toxin [Streptomyces sp. DT2A-34]
MDTSWWLALAAVILLALVAALVDGWGRGRRPERRRTRPPGRSDRRTPARPKGRGAARPAPAEIWWANVPYEDGPESRGAARWGSPHAFGSGGASGRAVTGDGRAKDRPCLVLAVRGQRVTVAKITSKYHGERGGVIPLPPGSVGDTRGRASYLETGELRDVPVRDFRRRVGVMDPVVWDQVRHLAT